MRAPVLDNVFYFGHDFRQPSRCVNACSSSEPWLANGLHHFGVSHQPEAQARYDVIAVLSLPLRVGICSELGLVWRCPTKWPGILTSVGFGDTTPDGNPARCSIVVQSAYGFLVSVGLGPQRRIRGGRPTVVRR
jgi:hypothetical protein